MVPLQCTLQEQESKFNGRKINDTFTNTVVKGSWKKMLMKTVAHAVLHATLLQNPESFFLILCYPAPEECTGGGP